MNAKIIADSKTFRGDRLVTIELEYPIELDAAIRSYRMLSINGPEVGDNVADFNGEPRPLGGGEVVESVAEFPDNLVHDRMIGDRASEYAMRLMSATELEHFIGTEHPELAGVKKLLQELVGAHKPKILRDGEWHLPYIELDDRNSVFYVPPAVHEKLMQISVARCARLGGIKSVEEDVDLHDRLMRTGNYSVFEHVAQAMGESRRVGNFVGWKQYRKFQHGEHKGRAIEFPVAVDTGYQPLYARMEEAFRQHLIDTVENMTKKMIPEEIIADDYRVKDLLSEFFPKDAKKLGVEEE